MTSSWKGTKVSGTVEFGDNGAVGLAVDELDDAVDEVTQLGEELAVVALHEGAPLELGVTSLRTVLQQVVSPHIGRDTSLFGVCCRRHPHRGTW